MHRSALVLLLLIIDPRLAAAEDPPATHPDAVELWVQPLGSVMYGGSLQGVYVSAGATVRLPQRWELVLEGAFQRVPTAYYDDDDGDAATVWQAWVSVAAVRFFQKGRPHDGFFVGPKLEGTVQHIGPCFAGECVSGEVGGGLVGALTVTYEAGYRFQFGHFVLSLIFPSAGVGYGWNRSLFLNPNLPGASVGASGFVASFDFNLLRLGVSF